MRNGMEWGEPVFGVKIVAQGWWNGLRKGDNE